MLTENGFYIGLYKEENGEWEDFGNLTVNLPHEDVKKNEAFIDHNFFESKLQFIKKYQLGEILPETAVSGYCTFSKVAFDLDGWKNLIRTEYARTGNSTGKRAHQRMKKRIWMITR